MNSTDNHSQGSFTENKWLYEHLKQGLVRVHFFYFEKKKISFFHHSIGYTETSSDYMAQGKASFTRNKWMYY